MEYSNQVSISDVYQALMNINQNLTEKIEGIEKNIKNLSTKIDNEVVEIKERVQKVQKENIDLKKRLNEVERKLKSKNLVLYGIREQEEISTVSIVQDLFENKLKITNFSTVEISNAFRLGKKIENKIRPILVELTTYFRKQQIISSRGKLKGTKIYISEDLTHSERKEKKELLDALRDIKKVDQSATVKGSYIVIESNKYTLQDIRENKHVTTSYDYLSPPPPRNAISEPATPVTSLVVEELLPVDEPIERREILENREEEKEKEEELPEVGKVNPKPKNTVQRTSSRSRTNKK